MQTGVPSAVPAVSLPAALCIALFVLTPLAPAAPTGPTAPSVKATARMEQRHEAVRQAIQRGDIAQARALVALGIDPRLRDAGGHTLLHDAVVFSGDPDLVRELLRAGVAVDTRSALGQTPLQAAVAQARYADEPGGAERLLAVVERLLAAGAATDGEDGMGQSLFEPALARGHEPLLQRLLQHGMPMPQDALLQALAAAEDAAGVQRAGVLLERAQPAQLVARDAEGRTPAHLAAARAEQLPLLQRLAARGADLRAVDGQGHTVFAAAAFAANLPALRWLAERGALTLQPAADGQTPLHLAAYEPRAQTLQWLLEQGAPRDARDRHGRRALDIALDTHRFAWRSPAEKLALAQLLGGGAEDVARGRFAQHPVHAAIAARDLGAVEALLRQGADPNVRDDSGHAPLYAALSYCSALPNSPAERAFGRKLLPLLLRHGADPRRLHEVALGRSYIDVARELRVLDLLEAEMRAHSPRR